MAPGASKAGRVTDLHLIAALCVVALAWATKGKK